MSSSKKIRILECIRQGQIGGGESHLLSLVENLDRERFDVIVLSFTDGPMITRLTEMGIETHVIYSERPFDITKWLKVKRLLKAKKIDLVHAHGTRASSNVLWAARSLHIPVIYTIHGWSFHQDQHPLVRKARILGERYLTSKSNANISVSASNKASGEQVIRSFQSTVINNGIDQRKFSPDRSYKNIREELNIASNAVLVLFVARFTHQKQPLLLIEAFKKAVGDYPQLHLLMIGDGDLRKEAVELANKMDMNNSITFQSFRQDVPDLLAAADIFVLPSLWEGLPIALLEAMAMKKAVIATDVDGTKEVISHEENGYLIESGNADMLATALIKLGKDYDLRKKFEQNAFDTVQEQFNASDMTRKIEHVYTSLLG